MMPGDFTEGIDTLLAALGQELGVVPAALRRFGRKSLGYLGASDGAAGVQWNAWVDAREEAAFLPEIREKHIGVSERMPPAIEPAAWAETLHEAYACLDADRNHRGRATQTVTTVKGACRELPVSPHLQFRQRLAWNPGHGWGAAVAEVRRNLRPLYAWVAEQSAT
jgi:hypothetical protein